MTDFATKSLAFIGGLLASVFGRDGCTGRGSPHSAIPLDTHHRHPFDAFRAVRSNFPDSRARSEAFAIIIGEMEEAADGAELYEHDDPITPTQVREWVGMLHNVVPPALQTQTTAADAPAVPNSARSLWLEVDALGGNAIGDADHPHNQAIMAVLDVLERRGFTEYSDAPVSYDRFRRLVDRIATWSDDELAAVDAAQTRYVARGVVAGEDPEYPAFDKGGVVAAENQSTWAADAQTNERTNEHALAYIIRKGDVFYRDHAQGYTGNRAEAGRFTLGEAVDLTHPNGMHGPRDGLSYELANAESGGPPNARPDLRMGVVVRDSTIYTRDGQAVGLTGSWSPDETPPADATLDPTPEEQRERFDAIKAKPRPSAGAIKFLLDRLDEQGRSDFALGHTSHAANVRSACLTIDKLAVDLLATEIERDDLRRQLDTIAANAKPVEGTELAELVQEARMHLERMKSQGIAWLSRAKVMERLIAAVNDQARKLREWQPRETTPAQRAEAFQQMSADPAAYLERQTFDQPYRDWPIYTADAVSRVLDKLREREAARTYTDEQRDLAAEMVRRRAMAGQIRAPEYARSIGAAYGDTVDAVATALGMERAK